jgi:3,4-dihydroxy 2-butanone 4-phosphate synthase/GTP cyclohydrolase II
MMNEKTIEFLDEGAIETEFGPFTMQRYRDTIYENIHFVLKKGEINPEEPTMTRVHVPNTVRDVLLAHVPENDNGWNIPRSLKAINEAGTGVLVLIAGDESNQAKLFSSDVVMGKQDLPTAHPSGGTEMNLSVGLGSQLIREAGVRRMKLMSNPVKYNAISGFDLEVVDFVSFKG